MEVQGWDGFVLGNFSGLACQGADSRGIFALRAEKCTLRPKFLKHGGGQITEQSSVSEFWGNPSMDKLPVCIPSCALLLFSYFHCNPCSRSCVHVPVQVCLQQTQKKLVSFPYFLYFTDAAALQQEGALCKLCFFTMSLKFSVSFCKDCESAKHLRFSDYKFYSLPAWRALDHSFILCFPQDPLIKSEGIVRIQRKSAIST